MKILKNKRGIDDAVLFSAMLVLTVIISLLYMYTQLTTIQDEFGGREVAREAYEITRAHTGARFATSYMDVTGSFAGYHAIDALSRNAGFGDIIDCQIYFKEEPGQTIPYPIINSINPDTGLRAPCLDRTKILENFKFHYKNEIDAYVNEYNKDKVNPITLPNNNYELFIDAQAITTIKGIAVQSADSPITNPLTVFEPATISLLGIVDIKYPDLGKFPPRFTPKLEPVLDESASITLGSYWFRPSFDTTIDYNLNEFINILDFLENLPDGYYAGSRSDFEQQFPGNWQLEFVAGHVLVTVQLPPNPLTNRPVTTRFALEAPNIQAPEPIQTT